MVKKKDIANGAEGETYLSRSPYYLAFRKFVRHPLAKWGGMTLLILYICIAFAEFIVPYNYRTDIKRKSYMQPVRVHFFDQKGKFHLQPFIYNYVEKRDPATYRRYFVEEIKLKRNAKRYPIKLFARGDEYEFLWLIPTSRHLFGIELGEEEMKESTRPVLALLGTDQYGRDLLSRLIFGGRVSLTIGILGFAITFILGLTFGGISGYFGGSVDVGIQRFVEMLMLFPFFYLLLNLRAAMPGDIE